MKVKVALAPLIFFIISTLLTAHPHVFIDAHAELIIDKNGMINVRESWVFDDMFSSMIIEDYDKDKDGKFSEEEIVLVQKEAFNNTREFQYFTFMRNAEGAIKPIGSAHSFTASITDENLLEYSFVLPYRPGISSDTGYFAFGLYDESFYVAIESSKDKMYSVTAESGVNAEIKTVDHYEKESYDWGTPPQEIMLAISTGKIDRADFSKLAPNYKKEENNKETPRSVNDKGADEEASKEGENPDTGKKIDYSERKLSLKYFVMEKIVDTQRLLRNDISTLFEKMKKEGSRFAIVLILLFSFAYGLVHALGPGHGKAIVSSYFISKNVKVHDGIIVGSFIALIHAFSAAAVVLVIYFFAGGFSTSRVTTEVSPIIAKVSSILIVGIGLFLLFSALYERFFKKDEKKESSLPKSTDRRGLLLIAASIGAVPCPGALLILFFAMRIDALFVGLYAVLAMSIGMAATLSSIAVLTILVGRKISENKERSGLMNKLSVVIRYVSYAAIVVFGVLLFVSSFNYSPF